MTAATKTWIAAETKRGRRAARLPIALGATQVLGGIAQAGCAALLLSAVLARHGGLADAGYACGFALCALLRAGLNVWAERAGFERGAASRRRLRSGSLGALLALGPAGLRGRHSAELAGIAVDRVEALDGFHARWLPAASLAGIGPALVGIAALIVDRRAGLILCIAGLLVPVAMALAGIGAGVAAKRQFVTMSRLQLRFLDRIRGISTIVLAGRAADEVQNLAAAAAELRIRTMRVLRVAFLSSTALDLAAAAALVLIVFRYTGLLRGDPAAAAPALFLLLLVPEFFAPLRAFSAVYADRLAAEAVADALADLPEAPPEAEAATIRSVAAQGLTLAFEGVSFAWNGTTVLDNLSFRVGAGDILLITGASGAGKSTILDLILGFLAPDSGKITLNGAPIDSLIPAARTRNIAWIGQKPMIFNGTIAENIMFARPEASEEDLAAALRLARLGDVIAGLPEGAATRIGEGGFGLSGGQAQRVAIARAFLKDSPLLLLDEPTAHLDPAAEQDILASLRRLAVGRAVILASHSTLAASFARDEGARRLDLDQLRHARLRGVA